MKTGSINEYEQLRSEMSLRLQLLYDYGSRTITMIVAIFAALFAGASFLVGDTNSIVLISFLVFVCVISYIIIITIHSQYVKFLDNLQQICALSAHILVLFEMPSLYAKNGDPNIISWELSGEVHKFNFEGLNKHQMRKKFSLFDNEFVALAIITLLFYVFSATFLCCILSDYLTIYTFLLIAVVLLCIFCSSISEVIHILRIPVSKFISQCRSEAIDFYFDFAKEIGCMNQAEIKWCTEKIILLKNRCNVSQEMKKYGRDK